jgi:hypothetical protein
MRHVAMLVAVVLTLSCGGGDEAPNDAPQKCEALVTQLCVRVVACQNGATTMSECVAEAKAGLPCAQADGVSDGYPACLTEIQSSPCSVLVGATTITLPATCTGSIIFRQ